MLVKGHSENWPSLGWDIGDRMICFLYYAGMHTLLLSCRMAGHFPFPTLESSHCDGTDSRNYTVRNYSRNYTRASMW